MPSARRELAGESNSMYFSTDRAPDRCRVHADSCPGCDECLIVTIEDYQSHGYCMQRDMRLPFQSTRIALRCRPKVEGVRVLVSKNQGEEFDHSTSYSGATLRAFDENKLFAAFELIQLV